MCQINHTACVANLTLRSDHFTGCEIFYFVVSGLCGILTILVGLIGNTLAFVVLHRMNRRCVIFFILKTLVVVDTLFLVTYGVVRVSAHLLDSLSSPAIFGRLQVAIYALFPVLSMTLTLTLWLTCLLVVHRLDDLNLCLLF